MFHVFIDIGDVKPHFASTMLFFQSFSFGIMIEDSLQAVWRKFTGEKFAKRQDYVPLWKKIIGFIWVSTFLVMVTPWDMYPAARAIQENSSMMPFAITKALGEQSVVTALLILGSILVLVFNAEI
jgi:hypothetical protein